MQLSIDQKDIDKFLMIGDKVLIKPKNPQSQTKTGLYLPPSVQQGEKIQAGYPRGWRCFCGTCPVRPTLSVRRRPTPADRGLYIL